MKAGRWSPASYGANRSVHFFLTLGFVLAVRAAEPDLPIADFEGATYSDWKVAGDAFGAGPAHGTLPSQMAVSGFRGRGLVNSYHGGDRSVGRLTSPEFTIRRSYITFLIGGGGWEGRTCLNLLVGGKIVRTATGPNTQPGGSEELAPASWDVREWAGKSAQIEIVDDAVGGWGHINVDEIVQTDRKPPALLIGATRSLVIRKRYLNLPVRTGAPKRRMSLLVEGRVVREFDIETGRRRARLVGFPGSPSLAGQTGDHQSGQAVGGLLGAEGHRAKRWH